MLNKTCSVYPLARFGFEVEHVVRKCLAPFPTIWVSVDKISSDGTYLTMLSVVGLLAGEC